MRYGSKLKTTILRQVDPELSSKLQSLTEFGMAIIAGLMLFLALLLVIAGDSLLPIWIFVTSLTLLVHTVLFRAELPSDVFVVLKTMLKVLRLDFLPLDSESHVPPPDEFLVAGYQSTQFVTNMGYLLLAPLALCLTLWILGLVKDIVTPKAWRDRSCCKPALNMFLRVLILTLLEVCICAGLELRGRFDLDESRESGLAQFGFYIAAVLLGLTLILTCYLFAVLSGHEKVVVAEVQKVKTNGVALDKKGDI